MAAQALTARFLPGAAAGSLGAFALTEPQALRIFRIYEGRSEIQQTIIARGLPG